MNSREAGSGLCRCIQDAETDLHFAIGEATKKVTDVHWRPGKSKIEGWGDGKVESKTEFKISSSCNIWRIVIFRGPLPVQAV